MSHLKAIQERHPSLYHHEDAFFQAVEQEGAKAGQAQSVENEIILLRARLLKLMKELENKTATGKTDQFGKALPMTTKEEITAMKELADIIGKLIKIDYDIGSEEMISLNSYKVWAARLARAIQEVFPDPVHQALFVQAAKKAGEPKRG